LETGIVQNLLLGSENGCYSVILAVSFSSVMFLILSIFTEVNLNMTQNNGYDDRRNDALGAGGLRWDLLKLSGLRLDYCRRIEFPFYEF